jgi:hypothetical protein
MDSPQFGFTVTHADGPRLDGFPLLAYAPDYWGPGVRTEDNGSPVAEIAAAHTGDFATTAKRFKTTERHVRQAIAYAMIG